ncbi:hypothetical protein GRI97_08925 [Altererythrobacter xixiisoli]|uniref:Glycosyl transferase family 28 C-terminal domain-containing protein n=1 Tax=Croceibacterium xixiisoli TaxID=1476466 RepID=A0A6I4TV51_9SPHN|nr:hypothetical protein [Croceibacterium xixiisoli]
MRFALVGTGGSSGHTLAAVEQAIRAEAPDSQFLFIDTQPFNLRTRGKTVYPGQGEVRTVSPEDCGIRNRTGSQTMNLLLSGGPLAYRRLLRRARSLLAGPIDALIMCHDRMYIETALLRAARAQGTPTVLLQEGPFCAIGNARPQANRLRLKAMLAPLLDRSGLLPAIPDYGLAGHDLVVAASAAYRDRWAAAGVNPAQVALAGVPRFDALHTLRNAVPPLPAGDRLELLYLVQPFAAHGKVTVEAAAEALHVIAEGLSTAAGDGAIRLTIRLHPRSSGDDIHRLRETTSIEVVEDEGRRPIEQAIGAAHVVIGHYSTGLLESLVLGRPVLVVPIPRAAFAEQSEADKQDWLTRTGLPIARTPQELASGLRHLRSHDGLADIDCVMVAQETGVIDGQATARAARAILHLVDQPSGGN